MILESHYFFDREMKLFQSFFKNWKNKEEIIPEDSLLNSNDLWADSVTTGWEYTCNLFLETPKICLENDGLISEGVTKPELFGEPNQFSLDGEPSGKYGSWTRRMGYEEEFEIYQENNCLVILQKAVLIIFYLPTQLVPFPSKPELHVHLCEPTRLVHVAFA